MSKQLDRVSFDLLKAAEIMKERGWCKGFDTNPEDGSVCLIGAIMVASSFNAEKLNECAKRVYDALPSAANRNWNDVYPNEHVMYWNVMYWNDKYCGSKEEAMALLRSAAMP